MSGVDKAKPAGRKRKNAPTHGPSGQAKAKSQIAGRSKTKRRTYTEEELGIPKLNMITPAGVQKPRGQKKGKTFVDDEKSMMTILAMVNAEKEGEIESKTMRARQLREIREAREEESKAKEEQKRQKLESSKQSLRKARRGRKDSKSVAHGDDPPGLSYSSKTKKKVSFS